MTAQIEGMGVPCALHTVDAPLLPDVARTWFRRTGMRECRQVVLPRDEASEEYIPKFIDALTRPLTEEEKTPGKYIPDTHPGIFMTGTFDEVQEAFRGDLRYGPIGGGPWAEMTDGGPVVPPTRERVDAMLTGTSHSPDEELHVLGEKSFFGMNPARIFTVEKVAINAVMAGCTPEMFPAVLAIAESGACVGYPGDSSFGHMYVVSGPYGKEIGMNSGFNLLNTGNPANVSLQRACSLMGINLGGCMHGINCLERTGTLHWGTIFAENEDSPWEGLNENQGYDADESILVAWRQKVQLVPFQQIEVLASGAPRECPEDTLLKALGTLTNQSGAIVLFTPNTARRWAEDYGHETMRELQDYLWDNVTRTKAEMFANSWFMKHKKIPFVDQVPRGSRALNPDYYDLPDDAQVPLFLSPEAITIIVAGGEGNAWAWGSSCLENGGKPAVYSIDKWR